MRTIDPAILFAAMATTVPPPQPHPRAVVPRPRRVTFAPVQPPAITVAAH